MGLISPPESPPPLPRPDDPPDPTSLCQPIEALALDQVPYRLGKGHFFIKTTVQLPISESEAID